MVILGYEGPIFNLSIHAIVKSLLSFVRNCTKSPRVEEMLEVIGNDLSLGLEYRALISCPNPTRPKWYYVLFS